MPLTARIALRRGAGMGVALRIPGGLMLTGMSWAAYWTAVRAWTEVFFFGVWFGYVLTVDGLVQWRTGTSLMHRGARRFILLFGASIPFWWMFEWCNWRLRNWSYVYPVPQNQPSRVLLCSLAFSAVLPALFETAELVQSSRAFRGPWRGPRLPHSERLLRTVTMLGVAGLALMLAFPRQLFPMIWLFPLMVLDPVNSFMGWPSIWHEAAHGRWRLPVVLALTGLMCGFFWEFWNNWSAGAYWVYHLPRMLSYPHLFRMPVAGYLGYLPFAASAYACYQTARNLVAPRSGDPLTMAELSEEGR